MVRIVFFRTGGGKGSLYGLCILAMLCSIPYIHKDLHLKNIYVFMPEQLFKRIWTIQIDVHLFEISWIMYGTLTLIDWEKFEDNLQSKPCSSRFRELWYRIYILW